MKRRVDLTGRVFGHLKVLNFSHEEGQHNYWLCVCDCGKEKTIRANNLTTGHTKSCGCRRIKDDLTDQKFGKLLVLGYSHNNHNIAHWKCRCDCGTNLIVQAGHLKSGTTKSCGCITGMINLSGERFGRLFVRSFSHTKNKHQYWDCVCDCGNNIVVEGSNLRRGKTQSCGCYMRDRAIDANYTHGMTNSKVHRAWSMMKDRCYNTKNNSYHIYGGSGVLVCDSWKDSFDNFYADMGDPPSDTHRLDRVDYQGNFEPGNCVWLSVKDQAKKRVYKRRKTFNNELNPVVTKDLTGQVFGRWTVLGFSHKNSQHHIFWKCQCSCGNVKDINGVSLRFGYSQSCGCLKRDITSEVHKTHGESGNNRIYPVWKTMKSRCFNVNSTKYSKYGGRGITVCDRWKDSFENFYKDMGEPPTDKHQIDRIDNDGPYSPENCRWVTNSQNARNKKNNKMITYQGKTQCLADWVDELGLNYTKVEQRLRVLKWSVEDAFEK